MSTTIRQARAADAPGMCALLNPIIQQGGTTAHINTFSPDRMRSHYIEPPHQISCFLAVENAQVLGFQALEWADPNWPEPDPIPADWAIIASFVSASARGKGIGRALFGHSQKQAQLAGAVAIDATIRADNLAGLGFYTALGFTDYGHQYGAALSDGTKIDKIRKKFSL